MPDQESVKAARTTIQIGSFSVDGFMLPDGSYRMSLSQVAECVELAPRNAFDFLRSKAFKSLMGEGFAVSISNMAGKTRCKAKIKLGHRLWKSMAVGRF